MDMIQQDHIGIGIGIGMIHSDHIGIGMVVSVEPYTTHNTSYEQTEHTLNMYSLSLNLSILNTILDLKLPALSSWKI